MTEKNKKGRKWTPKNELFAKTMAGGGVSQCDAYRIAYNAENMSNNAIYCEASKLMADPMVSQRIAEIKKDLADKELWTREMAVKELKEALGMAKGIADPRNVIGAVKELNIMHGFDAPEKSKNNEHPGIPTVIIQMPNNANDNTAN